MTCRSLLRASALALAVALLIDSSCSSFFGSCVSVLRNPAYVVGIAGGAGSFPVPAAGGEAGGESGLCNLAVIADWSRQPWERN